MSLGRDAAVVLLGNDLLRFAEVLEIARLCRRIIVANFDGTLAVDGIGVLLAAFGFLNPVLAAIIHVSSELLFILNSARLLPRESTRQIAVESIPAFAEQNT
jgi:Cd2+/Zn2+-exporting ATPase/Cu+-exporting ATPase